MRQAITYAIDRDEYRQANARRRGDDRQYDDHRPGLDGQIPGLNDYEYDPNKAKQLLKDANWDASQKFVVAYTAAIALNDAYMAIVQQQLKDVGISLDLQPRTRTEYTRRTTSPDERLRPCPRRRRRLPQDPNVSAKYFESTNFTPAGGNYGHYSNPKVDDLFKQGRDDDRPEHNASRSTPSSR